MYYVGDTFDTKTNRQYKTLERGKAAAEKSASRLFDDAGKVVADFVPVAQDHGEPDGGTAPEPADAAQEAAQAAPDAGDGLEHTPAAQDAQEAQDAAQEGTQDAPGTGEGQEHPDAAQGNTPGLEAAKDPDADTGPRFVPMRAYDAQGAEIGTMTPEDIALFLENAGGYMTAVNIRGKIRRLFPGLLRLRNSPAWGPDNVAGATDAKEMKVTAFFNASGRPMFRLDNGFYITGEPGLVEYMDA